MEDDFLFVNQDASHYAPIHDHVRRRGFQQQTPARSFAKVNFPWTHSENEQHEKNLHRPKPRRLNSAVRQLAPASETLQYPVSLQQETASDSVSPIVQVKRLSEAHGNLSNQLLSALDPFFPLPCHLTQRERSLLQYYFSEMPRAIFGTHSKAAFCPVRDCTTITACENQTFVQWLVLAADLALMKGNPSATSEPRILRRKAYIYGLMKKLIADPKARNSDHTLTALAAAGIAERRFIGESKLARKHLVALRLLMEARGGSSILRDMLFGQSVSITICFISTGTGEATFADKASLNFAIDTLVSRFLDIQSWNQSLRLDFEECDNNRETSGARKKGQDKLAVSDTQTLAQLKNVQRYRISRRYVFGLKSLLRMFIAPRSSGPADTDRRCHFAVLWIINNMLYDLRHDYHESCQFIQHLLNGIMAGEIPSAEQSRTPGQAEHLKPVGVVSILADSAAKHGSELATNQRGGILHSWDAIDMLELMELATRDSHGEMTSLMSSWLTNDDLDICFMTERRLEEISNEIRTEWLRRREVGYPERLPREPHAHWSRGCQASTVFTSRKWLFL